MVKEKNITSTSQSKKPKLLETVTIPSNLRRSSRSMVHLLEFSNIANNLIEVEEKGSLSKSNEQGSAFEEEASSEKDIERNKNSKDSKDTSIVTPQKYPRIFIIILLYIPGMN